MAEILVYGSIFAWVVCPIVSALIFLIINWNKEGAQDIAARFSLAEVREHAESLHRWFKDDIANHPDLADCLRVGSKLAQELVTLASQPELTHKAAVQFEERVRLELKGYKGSPFSRLYHLSHRLAELTDQDRAAGEGAPADKPPD